MARAVAGDTRTALAAQTAVDGQGAILWEEGRQGQFVFYGDDMTVEVAVDGSQGVFIPPSSDPTGAAGAWVRQFSGALDITWFGAVADDATDSRSAIQAAVDFVEAMGGGAIRASGDFYLSGSVALCPNLTLKGDNKRGTTFRSTHAGSGTGVAAMQSGSLLYLESPINGSTAANLRIENIQLKNNNAANVGAGFYDQGGTFLTIENVNVEGFRYGIVFDQTELADITSCTMQSQVDGGASVWLANGADINPSGLPMFTNRISVKQCQINQGPLNYGILDDGGYCHAFEDNNYNGCLNHIRIGGEAYVQVRGGEFESSAGDAISVNLDNLSGAINGSNVVFVQGSQFAETTGNAAIGCGGGAGTVGVGGGTTFAGGGGTNAITGAANLFRLWLGHIHNATGIPVADGQATNHNDTTGAIAGSATATAPGTGFISSPSLKATATGSVDGDVVTFALDHGGNGGQVYLQALLTLATGYSKYVVRTRAGDGMGERMRIDDTGLNLSTGEVFKIAGTQVVGARGSALPADATDLATVITLANAIKARLKATGGHGLVAD